MGLETGTYISDLIATNPVGATDDRATADDHLRLIKAVLKNTFPASGIYPAFPAGTVMLFMQAAAPTGWTQITTHNDKALRVVSGTGAGSGGATAFTTVFGASKATASGDVTLPAHTHTFSATTSSDGSHTHSFVGIATTGTDTRINAGTVSGTLANTNTNGAHTHSVSGTTATAGSGTGSHVHGLSLDLQYVDIIACSKD